MAIKANLIIDQGSTYSTSVDVTDADGLPINLTGYTGTAQIRKHYSSTNATSFGVSIGALDGTITLSLTSTQTAALVAGRYVYDCEIVSPANTTSRIVEGIVTITPQVTR